MSTLKNYAQMLYQIRPKGVSESELYETRDSWHSYIFEVRKYMTNNHLNLTQTIEEVKQKKSKLSSKARQMLTIFSIDKLNEMLFKE